MTNFEHIKEIVDEENYHKLRDLIVNLNECLCNVCRGCSNRAGDYCADGVFKWLSMEYDYYECAWKRGREPDGFYMIKTGK